MVVPNQDTLLIGDAPVMVNYKIADNVIIEENQMEKSKLNVIKKYI